VGAARPVLHTTTADVRTAGAGARVGAARAVLPRAVAPAGVARMAPTPPAPWGGRNPQSTPQPAPSQPAGWHVPAGAPQSGPPVSAPPVSGGPPGGYPAGLPPVPRMPPPKRDGRRWVLWLLLAIFLVCCVGGGGTLGGFAYIGHDAGRDDTVTALEGYLEDVKQKRYNDAYQQLCDKAKVGVDLERFSQRTAAGSPLTSYDIDEKSMDGQFFDVGFNVDVELRFANGERRTQRYYVESDDNDLDKYVICPQS